LCDFEKQESAVGNRFLDTTVRYDLSPAKDLPGFRFLQDVASWLTRCIAAT
jgi:hypothetical protein